MHRRASTAGPADARVLEFYAQIKWVHIVAVLLSGSLFCVRGFCALGGAGWPYAAAVRFASYAIDTTLLTAALMLATMLPSAMFANHWLTIKLCLIVVYVVLGVLALRRGRAPRARLACFVLALATYTAVIGIAIAHHPLGWGRLLYHHV